MSELDDIKAWAAELDEDTRAIGCITLKQDYKALLARAIAIAEDQIELTRLAGENEQLMHVARDDAQAEIKTQQVSLDILAKEASDNYNLWQKARAAALALRDALFKEAEVYDTEELERPSSIEQALADTEWLEEH